MKIAKLKKGLITLSLAGCLLGINAITTFAGTERQFWDMNIYSLNGSNHLQSRAKETNNAYSWVKVTNRSSNLSSIDFKIQGGSGSFDCSSWNSVSSLNYWQRLDYDQYDQLGTGIYVWLAAMNSSWSTKSGTISGYVDYE